LPLGLSGFAFSSTVFFSKYQVWFLGLGVMALAVAHYVAWKGHSLVRPLQAKLLWVSTLLTVISIGYYFYSNYYFLMA